MMNFICIPDLNKTPAYISKDSIVALIDDEPYTLIYMQGGHTMRTHLSISEIFELIK